MFLPHKYNIYKAKCTKSITTVERHYVRNYFYCRIRPEELLDDAERDLLAIAKLFLYFNADFIVE